MDNEMKRKRVFVAGQNGMVGSAIVRQLAKLSDVDIVTRTRAELDLTNQQAVFSFFQEYGVAFLCGRCKYYRAKRRTKKPRNNHHKPIKKQKLPPELFE